MQDPKKGSFWYNPTQAKSYQCCVDIEDFQTIGISFSFFSVVSLITQQNPDQSK